MKLLFPLLAILSACARHSDPANTVHLNLPARVKSLDPIQGNDLYSIVQSSYAHETLLEYHYFKRPYVLIPRLALALPERSRDGLTYTFRIRPGVRFADDAAFPGGKGRELRAQDFVYSWLRLADPRNAAGGWWMLDGKIAGLNEWRANGKRSYGDRIVGLQALDDHTLVVRLKRRSATFLYALATLPTAAVAREAVEKYGSEFGLHAVGTGPYRLSEITATKLVWDKNPSFRRVPYPSEGEPGDPLGDAGKPLPLNDRIVTEVNEESLPAWLGFKAGKLDLAGVPKDAFSEALPEGRVSEELASRGVRRLTAPLLDLTRVSFNLKDPLLGKNAKLREAISLAFDPAPVIRLFYNGQAVPSGPIPPGLPGYDATLKDPFRGPDLERAKKLLAEAGYPGGQGLPPLEYVAVSSSAARQFTDYLTQQLGAIGVKVKAESYSWPEYTKRVMDRRGQLWSFGWMPFYPDAENFLQLFYSKNSAAGGPNDMGYANPAYDELFERARIELDEAKRVALYKKMAALVIKDAPCIFLLSRTDNYLVHPWLKNVKPNNFALDEAKYFRVER